MINNKNEICKQYIHNGKLQHDYKCLKPISNTLLEVLKASKQKYYSELSNKINNPWIILKTYVQSWIIHQQNYIESYLERFLTVEKFRFVSSFRKG